MLIQTRVFMGPGPRIGQDQYYTQVFTLIVGMRTGQGSGDIEIAM